MAYWLLKTEPSTYSIDQLKSDKRTHWDQVRNFQARNFLRQAKVGDLALIYHSNDDKAVVGVAKVVREAYPDIDPEGGNWSQIDIAFVQKLERPVPLAEIKSTPALKDIPLIRQSRLSCMPVTAGHFKTVTALAQKPVAPAPVKKTVRKPQPKSARA